MNFGDRHLVLASGSPRRRELLSMLLCGGDFEVRVPCDVDESFPAEIPADEVPCYLAAKKAQAYIDTMMCPGDIVIASDTIVLLDGVIMGKPADEAQAREMLRRLSGRTHLVITGVAVVSRDTSDVRKSVTEVTFAPLTDEEIDTYMTQFRPLDKAGAYGIQEWIGCIGVSSINGSFYNVMGLPLHVVYSMLLPYTQTDN